MEVIYNFQVGLHSFHYIITTVLSSLVRSGHSSDG